MNQAQYDKVVERFRKVGLKSLKLSAKLDALRPAYDMAFKTLGRARGIEKFNAICSKMQKIQAQMEKLWEPHRRVLGTCPKCKGTRMPAVQGKKQGFGCFNSECYYLDAVTKQAS